MTTQYNIVARQNKTLTLSLVVKSSNDVVIDITNYKFRLQARSTVQTKEKFLDVGTHSGHCAITGPQGKVVLTVPAAEMLKLYEFKEGVYDYLMLEPSGKVTPLLEGQFTVERGITQDLPE